MTFASKVMKIPDQRTRVCPLQPRHKRCGDFPCGFGCGCLPKRLSLPEKRLLAVPAPPQNGRAFGALHVSGKRALR